MKYSSAQVTHQKYRPDIDGLRAVAILSVICFHAFPKIIPSGFIGVDIFFVISGYLISTILFGSLEQDTFSIFEFYERRICRIFPALIAVMFMCIVAGWYILFVDEYRQICKHILSSSVFIQNITLWKESGYFDTIADTKPMLHLWSLAIEEQFYIFWPLLLAFIWKRRINFLYITVILAIISFVSNIYFSITAPVADFYSPISRFWELMIGGILAYLQLHRPELIRNHKNIQSVFGFSLLAIGLIIINKERSFPGWWALLPTIGTFFIISAGATAWLNKNILSSRLCVWCGLISYPLYLWHWPLLSFATIVWPSPGYKLKIVILSLALILSVATYLYIEKRFRTAKEKFKPTMQLLSWMSLVIIAGLIVKHNNFEPRLHAIKNLNLKNEWDFIKSINNDINSNCDSFFNLGKDRNHVTLFIGDSQLAQYAERISVYQLNDTDSNGALFALGGGCPPIPNVYSDDQICKNCWENRDKAFSVAFNDNVSTVVLGGSWNWYFLSEAGYYFLDQVGNKLKLNSTLGIEKAFAALSVTLSKLKNSNKMVYLLLGNPINSAQSPYIYSKRIGNFRQPDRYVVLDESQKQLRLRLLDLATGAGVSVIDPYLTLCNNDKCERISETGIAVYKDSSHFNPDWAIEHTDYIDISLKRSLTN